MKSQFLALLLTGFYIIQCTGQSLDGIKLSAGMYTTKDYSGPSVAFGLDKRINGVFSASINADLMAPFYTNQFELVDATSSILYRTSYSAFAVQLGVNAYVLNLFDEKYHTNLGAAAGILSSNEEGTEMILSAYLEENIAVAKNILAGMGFRMMYGIDSERTFYNLQLSFKRKI